MSSDKPKKPPAAETIPRSAHSVSRDNISDAALKVLYRLAKAGYEAYLVGGSVRDLLLKHSPKDFDVSTSATPEQVNKLFRNSRVIGRRFRLVHVRFGREIIEVATFRSSADPENDDHDHEVSEGTGRVLRDNVYGTFEDDVWRRDFTANALYYNIADFSIRDCVGGVDDIKSRTLRMLGDPETRYREDPVRMLRAARFAAKLEFTIHPDTAEPLPRLAELLHDVPPARLFDECCKIFQSGHALEGFRHLRAYKLFRHLYPATAQWLDDGEANNHPERLAFIEQALANTDQRVAEDRPVTPMFIVGVFLWGPVLHDAQRLQEEKNCTELQAVTMAADSLVQRQNDRVFMPKRFSYPMREMLQLQPKFKRTKGKRAMGLLGHPRFRAAYDLLLLRQTLGEVDAENATWWTDVQTRPEGEQARAFAADKAAAAKSRRRPRRRRS